MGSFTHSPSDRETVMITQSDGFFVATDEETGVTSQGETKAEALKNLSDAIALYERPVSDEDEPREPSDAPWL